MTCFNQSLFDGTMLVPAHSDQTLEIRDDVVTTIKMRDPSTHAKQITKKARMLSWIQISVRLAIRNAKELTSRLTANGKHPTGTYKIDRNNII